MPNNVSQLILPADELRLIALEGLIASPPLLEVGTSQVYRTNHFVRNVAQC